MSAKTLIIGASGFIGTNLVKSLLKEGSELKALSRDPNKISVTDKNLSKIKGDLELKETINSALEGVVTVYYLAHGMDTDDKNFLEREVRQASNLASLLTKEQRVIYLGGIIPKDTLSEHLESRMQVGQILAASAAETIEFRASIVVGDGSASYDMVRALVRRLPFILKTNWSEALCQPIALENAISYLIQAKNISVPQKNNIINIGGTSKLPYRELMSRYAYSQNLIRPTIEINSFPKNIAKELLNIVAPEYYQVGSKLLESIEHETIVEDSVAEELFNVDLLSVDEMISKAGPIDLKEMNQAQIFRKLKDSKNLSLLMEGQILTLKISAPDKLIFKNIQQLLQKLLPKSNSSLNHIKIPFVGEIGFSVDDENSSLFIRYRPLYFFQELSWVFWEKIIDQIKFTLKKE